MNVEMEQKKKMIFQNNRKKIYFWSNKYDVPDVNFS